MTMNSGFDREVRFKIVERLGVLSTHSTGWNKELNLVSWNGGQAKYDIRDWDPEHEHMSRGITLHEKEMRQIVDLVKRRRAGTRFIKEENEKADDFEDRLATREDTPYVQANSYNQDMNMLKTAPEQDMTQSNEGSEEKEFYAGTENGEDKELYDGSGSEGDRDFYASL